MESKSSPEDQLYSAGAATDENFFDTSDVASPEYDNAVNQDMSDPNLSPEERERQQEEYRKELVKLEDEIMTLRQVLSAKVRQSGELKRKLGITPMVELKHDLKQGLQNIKESDAYQKTNTTLHKVGDRVASTNAYQKTSATLKTAGQKTSSAFSTFGSYTKTKLGEVRNSNAFKSFEEKIGGAYSNVRGEPRDETKVRGSQSEQNFEDVLNSTKEEDTKASSTPATPASEVPL